MDLPIGSIIMFDGATLPVGWYDCDGTPHNGITTPNLINSFPRGASTGGSHGVSDGNATHTHTNVDTGNATHGHGSKSITTSGANETVPTWGWAGVWNHFTSGSHTHSVTINAVSGEVSHSHTIPTTEPASSLPPNISLRYIMRCE